MASDKARAAMGFVKVIIALAAGYGIYYFWEQTGSSRFFDESIAAFAPYVAGLIVAAMVFFLLSRMGKSGGD